MEVLIKRGEFWFQPGDRPNKPNFHDLVARGVMERELEKGLTGEGMSSKLLFFSSGSEEEPRPEVVGSNTRMAGACPMWSIPPEDVSPDVLWVYLRFPLQASPPETAVKSLRSSHHQS